MIVKLLKPYAGCNAGEIAGFPDAEAEHLLEAGLASLPDGRRAATATVQPVDPGVAVVNAEPEDLAAEHEAFAAREERATAAPLPAPLQAPPEQPKPKKGRK